LKSISGLHKRLKIRAQLYIVQYCKRGEENRERKSLAKYMVRGKEFVVMYSVVTVQYVSPDAGVLKKLSLADD
jgi:hypothetical protein